MIIFLNSIMFQMVFVVAWINEHLPNEKTSKKFLTVLLAQHGGPTQNSDDKGYLGLNLWWC